MPTYLFAFILDEHEVRQAEPKHTSVRTEKTDISFQ
jgi:hypothetical protein